MKTKRTRVLALCVAAALLTSLTATGVSAQTVPGTTQTTQQAQTGTLDYSQIENLVRTQNLQVQNNELTRKNMSKNGNDALAAAKDGIEQGVQQLQTLAKSMDTVIAWATQKLTAASNPAKPDPEAAQQAQMMLTLAGGNKASLSMLASNLDSQAEQMTVSADQRRLVNLQLEQADNQLVSAAQTLFLAAKQLEMNRAQAALSRPLLETSLKVAQVQLSQGTGTQTAVTQAQVQLAEFDQSLAELNQQLTNLKHQLNNLLGRTYNMEFTLGALPTGNAVQNNLASDTKTALANSYTLRYKQEELDQMENDEDYDSVNREMRTKRNEIAMEEYSLQVSMEQQYQSIQTAQSAYALQQQKCRLQQEKYEQAALQYRLGTLSKLELESAQVDYAKAQSALELAQLEVLNRQQSYDWMKKGLPASSSTN